MCNKVWFGQEPEPEYNPGKTARDEERERLEQEIALRQVPVLSSVADPGSSVFLPQDQGSGSGMIIFPRA
jgi:hypothetical protein